MRRSSILIFVVIVISLLIVAPGILTGIGGGIGKIKVGNRRFTGTAKWFENEGAVLAARYKYHLGLDLQGGADVTYEIDTSKIDAKDKASSIESLKNVISNRVNQFGVSEPVIRTTKSSGKDFLEVELPGIKNVKDALDLIGKTAELEFKVEDPSGATDPQTGGPHYVSNNPQLKGSDLKRASQAFDQTGQAIVQLEFNDDGTKIFDDMTRAGVGKTIAIYLDGELLSAPRVNSEIAGGTAQISGSFTVDTAKQLAIELNAGALPVPLKQGQNRTIGATLGAESVNKSLFAGLIGVAAVMLFMILYYRLLGVVAAVALTIYILLSLALFRGLLSFILPFTPVTLTLAGIAGFVLSIGMAVDANVLIFERMKEELREGRSFESAVRFGFARAWNSIRDSNVSSLITTLILFSFGTGIIRGFAVTLALGILTSLFTAITVTRAILRFVTAHEWGRHPALYGFKFTNPEKNRSAE